MYRKNRFILNRKVYILAFSIGLIIFLIFSFTLNQNNSKSSDSVSTNTTSKITSSENDPKSTAGVYQDYSEDRLNSAKGTRILFFHAPWCPQCRALDLSIKSGKIPDDVTVFKVDYDTNNKLRQKYGITIQTTVVKVDENGNEVKKFVAYDDPSLQTIVNELL